MLSVVFNWFVDWTFGLILIVFLLRFCGWGLFAECLLVDWLLDLVLVICLRWLCVAWLFVVELLFSDVLL